MPVKLKNRDVINLNTALSSLSGQEMSGEAIEGKKQFVPVPFKIVYAQARTLSHLKDSIQAIEKGRQSIVNKYSAGKGTVTPESPGFAECQNEISELLDMVIEVEIHSQPISEFEKMALTPIMLSNLLPLIKE